MCNPFITLYAKKKHGLLFYYCYPVSENQTRGLLALLNLLIRAVFGDINSYYLFEHAPRRIKIIVLTLTKGSLLSSLSLNKSTMLSLDTLHTLKPFKSFRKCTI